MGKLKKTQQNVLKNSLESLQGYGSDAVKTVAKTATDEVDNFFSDLLGIGSSSESEQKGHHGEVEIYNSREKKAEVHVRAHVEYHDDMRKLGENKNRSENQQAIQKIQEALAEIQQLLKSSKALETEFADFAVMDAPKEVGDYDLNFFEWLIITIKQAREKVEDSGAWLSTVKGKNGKKGGQDYWSMFKKHGTAFGMSNERSSATSVG
jgi:hypothetical protein